MKYIIPGDILVGHFKFCISFLIVRLSSSKVPCDANYYICYILFEFFFSISRVLAVS
jgi:hypothetical protein